MGGKPGRGIVADGASFVSQKQSPSERTSLSLLIPPTAVGGPSVPFYTTHAAVQLVGPCEGLNWCEEHESEDKVGRSAVGGIFAEMRWVLERIRTIHPLPAGGIYSIALASFRIGGFNRSSSLNDSCSSLKRVIARAMPRLRPSLTLDAPTCMPITAPV